MQKMNFYLALLFSAASLSPALAAQHQNEPRNPMASLSSLNEKAEHAYESIYAGQSGRTLKDILAMHKYVSRLDDDLSSGQVETMQDTVASLEHALSTNDKHTALLASNQLTMLSAEASKQYDSDMPAEVTLLDYDGRQIQLWALESNMRELKRAAEHLRETWNKLLPDLEKRHASKEIEAFSALVDRVNRSTAVSEYAALANKILDAVDDVEKVYGH